MPTIPATENGLPEMEERYPSVRATTGAPLTRRSRKGYVACRATLPWQNFSNGIAIKQIIIGTDDELSGPGGLDQYRRLYGGDQRWRCKPVCPPDPSAGRGGSDLGRADDRGRSGGPTPGEPSPRHHHLDGGWQRLPAGRLSTLAPPECLPSGALAADCPGAAAEPAGNSGPTGGIPLPGHCKHHLRPHRWRRLEHRPRPP